MHHVMTVTYLHSYLYVLQICTDIRENRILVDGDDASHLASLLLQGILFLLLHFSLTKVYHFKGRF